MSTTAASSSSTARNWMDLPADVTEKILLNLGTVEIIESAQKVCLPWRRIFKDPSMWRKIDMCNLGDIQNLRYDLVKICRHAIDRSDGQLIEINIEDFCTDGLLRYIAERSSGLKRLRLVYCDDISDEGLIEAAAKLPLLEELELSYCPISKEATEAVRKSCPLLKSLYYYSYEDVHDWYDDPFSLTDDDSPPVNQVYDDYNHLWDVWY